MATQKKAKKEKAGATRTGAKKTTTRKKAGAAKTKAAPPPFSDNLKDGLLDRTDQMFSIMTKGLDLTEATMTLGLNMMNRLGTMAQDTIVNRMSGASPGQYQSEAPPQGEPYDAGSSPYADPGPAADTGTPRHDSKLTISSSF